VTRVATLRFQSFEILAGIKVAVGESLPKRDDHKLFVIELFTGLTFGAANTLTGLVHFRQCLSDDLVLLHCKSPFNVLGVITKFDLLLLHSRSILGLQPLHQRTFEWRVKTKEILQ
jgi:hypothetical protein